MSPENIVGTKGCSPILTDSVCCPVSVLFAVFDQKLGPLAILYMSLENPSLCQDGHKLRHHLFLDLEQQLLGDWHQLLGVGPVMVKDAPQVS